MKNVTFKTRHALVLSCISLMTCFAMLLGTTFAWFTDSVTSGVNHIIAGNLDVELYHQEMVNGAFGGTDTEVGSTTELFKTPATATSPMLWEPGAKAVEKFVVKNVGNLAFKYNMNLSVAGFNTVNTTKSLKDVIKVAVTDSVPAANTALTWQDLSTFTTTGAIQNGGTDKTFYVVLYWAPNDNDVDNIYNLNNGRKADDGSNKLTIDLGVTLVATQDTVESDSFSNQYDANATYPTVITATTVSAAYSAAGTSIGNIASDNAAATVPASTTLTDSNNTAIAGVNSLALQVKPTTKAAANATSSTVTVTGTESVDYYDISLVATSTTGTTTTETEVKSTSKVVKVEINLGTGLSNVKVNHKGTNMLTTGDTGYTADAANTFTYDATTGILTLYLNSFSPFAIGYDAPVAVSGGKYYATLKDAVDGVQSNATITLLRDAELVAINKAVKIVGNSAGTTVDTKEVVTSTEQTLKDVTFENITFKSTSGWAMNSYGVNWTGIFSTNTTLDNVTFKNCTFSTRNDSKTNCIYNARINNGATFDGCTIYGDTYGINFAYVNGTLTLKNCDISGWNSFGGASTNSTTGSKVVIENSNFHKSDYNKLRFYENAEIKNSTFDCKFLTEDMSGGDYGDFEAGVDVNTSNVTIEFTNCKVKNVSTGELTNFGNGYIYTCENDKTNKKFTGVNWKIDGSVVTPADEPVVSSAN